MEETEAFKPLLTSLGECRLLLLPYFWNSKYLRFGQSYELQLDCENSDSESSFAFGICMALRQCLRSLANVQQSSKNRYFLNATKYNHIFDCRNFEFDQSNEQGRFAKCILGRSVQFQHSAILCLVSLEQERVQLMVYWRLKYDLHENEMLKKFICSLFRTVRKN